MIGPMRAADAGQVLAIYPAGLDTGQASSGTAPPGWDGIGEVLGLRGRAGHERDHGDVPMRRCPLGIAGSQLSERLGEARRQRLPDRSR
jgi:hypothetical protein